MPLPSATRDKWYGLVFLLFFRLRFAAHHCHNRRISLRRKTDSRAHLLERLDSLIDSHREWFLRWLAEHHVQTIACALQRIVAQELRNPLSVFLVARRFGYAANEIVASVGDLPGSFEYRQPVAFKRIYNGQVLFSLFTNIRFQF